MRTLFIIVLMLAVGLAVAVVSSVLLDPPLSLIVSGVVGALNGWAGTTAIINGRDRS